MKRTPFYERHVAAGAKMIGFAGYDMPVQYPMGIVQEHLAVRNAVGVFDVSHMGEFEIRGKDALAFLQKATVNDVSKLTEGKVQYSALLYEHGGIVDDVLLYHCGEYYMMVVNASNITKDLDWLRSHATGNVAVDDVSDKTALLAVQGPRSAEALQSLASFDLSSLAYYRFRRSTIAGVPMIVSRTGYTGELGFELYFDATEERHALKIWDAVFQAGAALGISPVGLGARDTLRLEMGYCLYGNDIDENTNPLEAGLGWITKMEKGDFIGRESLLKVRKGEGGRALVGFTMPEKTLARHGFALKAGKAVVGAVTSGTFSPSLQRGIGLGYVERSLAAPGSSVTVDVRGREIEASIVELPFVRRS
ncbi:MAG TPA: glycine cleavage system aminomethyltransferase GcvT [Bacteroidota bacterium]